LNSITYLVTLSEQFQNPSEKDLQFTILNCTVVQYNKTLIDLIFG